ncbi:hypothetical protein C1646_752268 [Rhizophagus diaphanus]|nr:hypothetical protein C1646_752268 [Rhizophagus diaphanus] [Rhizophagus sp. MUCL 43196]
MENNNLLQDGFLNESELTELINDFYNYYGNISGVQPQTTDIQAQDPSLNTNGNNCDNTYGDFFNELFAMDDEEYSTFDNPSNQNYQQTPITPIPSNEQFTNNFNFIPTSNHCLPQSIPTQSIPDNYSYTFNTVTFDSLQENTSNTCEIFKFEYRVISVPATTPITPNTLITTTSNILEMRQLNYFSLNSLQMPSQL